MSTPLILYDGYCALCNVSVNFLQAREREGALAYASQQSAQGRAALLAAGLPAADLDTVVLIEGERVFTRSAAALRALRYLRQPWPLLGALRILPAWVRDPVYNFIAHNRYRLQKKP